MISVEQVRALEERVEKAVGFISALTAENAALRRDLEAATAEVAAASGRIHELEAAAEAFRRDQVGIEEGIVHALRKLDAFEDLVLKAGRLQAARPAESPAPAPVQAGDRVSAPPAPASSAAVAAAPVAAAPEPAPAEAAAPVPTASELSDEELEAATAPDPAPRPEAAPASEAPATPAAPVENELDIF